MKASPLCPTGVNVSLCPVEADMKLTTPSAALCPDNGEPCKEQVQCAVHDSSIYTKAENDDLTGNKLERANEIRLEDL